MTWSLIICSMYYRKLCGNTLDSDGDKLILAICSSPLTFLRILLIHLLLHHISLPDSASYGCPLLHFPHHFPPIILSSRISSSHHIARFHFFFFFFTSEPLLLPLLCFFFYPWLWLVFSEAPGNLIRPIKS